MAGPPYTSGQKLRASELNDAWTDFSASFAIFGSVTNPTKGNSTYTARYQRPDGHTVIYTVRILIGSTFSAGSGIYTMPLPVTASDASWNGATGSGWVNDSGTSLRIITVIPNDANGLQLIVPKGTLTNGGEASLLTNSVPQAWASPDSINFSIIYEV